MNYANIITQQTADKLPKVPVAIDTSVGKTTSPDAKQQAEWLAKQGWRTVSSEAQPSVGCRVTAIKVLDVGDGLTCRISIVSQINIADELAAQEAANAKAADDRRKAMVDYLCQGEVTRLFVALHNVFLDKPITEEAVRAEAEKILA